MDLEPTSQLAVAATYAAPVLSALIAAVVAYVVARREHRFDYSFERTLRISFGDRKMRTFRAIARRFPGVPADELRKSLIKAGYAAFYRGSDSAELWGLAVKHKPELRSSK